MNDTDILDLFMLTFSLFNSSHIRKKKLIVMFSIIESVHMCTSALLFILSTCSAVDRRYGMPVAVAVTFLAGLPSALNIDVLTNQVR